MKSKGLHFIVSFLLIALSACSSGTKVSFDFKDDSSLPHFSRRGENYLQRTAAQNSVSTVTIASDAEKLISRLEDGDDIFLYCYQTTCQHCRQFETKFVNYCLDSMTEVHSLDLTNGAGELYKLVETYPAFSPMLEDLTTPSIFFLSKSSEEEIAIETHMTSVESFESFISPLYNNTRIYRYTTYDGFMKCAEETEGLLYIDNGSAEAASFEAEALKQAKHQDKRLAWIDWLNVGEEDQAKFATLFGTACTTLLGQYEKGGVLSSSYNYVTSYNEALALANSYYAI